MVPDSAYSVHPARSRHIAPNGRTSAPVGAVAARGGPPAPANSGYRAEQVGTSPRSGTASVPALDGPRRPDGRHEHRSDAGCRTWPAGLGPARSLRPQDRSLWANRRLLLRGWERSPSVRWRGCAAATATTTRPGRSVVVDREGRQLRAPSASVARSGHRSEYVGVLPVVCRRAQMPELPPRRDGRDLVTGDRDVPELSTELTNARTEVHEPVDYHNRPAVR